MIIQNGLIDYIEIIMSFINLRSLSSEISLIEIDFDHQSGYLKTEDLQKLHQNLDDIAISNTQVLLINHKGNQNSPLYDLNLIYDSLNNVNQKVKALEYIQML